MTRTGFIVLTCFWLSACVRDAAPRQISVAGASNLTGVFQDIGREFTRRTGVAVIFNFASTAQLAHQIGNSAPFDVFAAADREHIEMLLESGKLERTNSGVFARGRLALWSPHHPSIRALGDLMSSEVRYIAVARPASAPYGRAAIEALRSTGVWKSLEPKIVYASNISMAKQLASTGNADAALTASSLVLDDPHAILIDDRLHKPIDLAIGVVSASPRRSDAARFAAFVLSSEGRAILQRYGYR